MESLLSIRAPFFALPRKIFEFSQEPQGPDNVALRSPERARIHDREARPGETYGRCNYQFPYKSEDPRTLLWRPDPNEDFFLRLRGQPLCSALRTSEFLVRLTTTSTNIKFSPWAIFLSLHYVGGMATKKPPRIINYLCSVCSYLPIHF